MMAQRWPYDGPMKMKTGFPERLIFPEVETILKLCGAENQYDRPPGFPTTPPTSRFTDHSTPDSSQTIKIHRWFQNVSHDMCPMTGVNRKVNILFKPKQNERIQKRKPPPDQPRIVEFLD